MCDIYMCVSYIGIYYYVCLCISEMNYNNDIRDSMEELGIFCNYKVLILP